MMAYGRALTVAAFTRKHSWGSGSQPACVVRCRQASTEWQHLGSNQLLCSATFAELQHMPCRPPSFRPVSLLRRTARCALLLIAITLFATPSEAAAQRALALRIAAA